MQDISLLMRFEWFKRA